MTYNVNCHVFPHKKDDKTANKNSTENFTRDQRLSITFSVQNLRTGRDNRGLMRLKHFLWVYKLSRKLSKSLFCNSSKDIDPRTLENAPKTVIPVKFFLTKVVHKRKSMCRVRPDVGSYLYEIVSLTYTNSLFKHDRSKNLEYTIKGFNYAFFLLSMSRQGIQKKKHICFL